MYLPQNCIMSIVCKIFFYYILFIVLRVCRTGDILVIQITLFLSYVPQFTSPPQRIMDCYAITIHLNTSHYYFQKGFHCIGVIWIPNYKIENCVHCQWTFLFHWMLGKCQWNDPYVCMLLDFIVNWGNPW